MSRRMGRQLHHSGKVSGASLDVCSGERSENLKPGTSFRTKELPCVLSKYFHLYLDFCCLPVPCGVRRVLPLCAARSPIRPAPLWPTQKSLSAIPDVGWSARLRAGQQEVMNFFSSSPGPTS